jgi:magnesium chelatase family protein
LPPLTGDEAFAVQLIRSAAGLAGEAASGDQPPYRAPHQSASLAALVGGGSQLLPGEISMAHHGVLFLDEAPEFRRDALEALRQPLESGVITIHRAQGSVTYPARCLLVLAQNPCPCGFAGAPTVGATPARRCTCSPTRLQQYSKKISGPLLDRIDLKVFLSDLPAAATTAANETSATIRKRVIAARSRQLVRQGRPNGQLTGAQLNAVITLTPPLRTVLDLARHQGLSLRGQLKTIRVARTIADLETCERVGLRHLQEALAYVLPQETL